MFPTRRGRGLFSREGRETQFFNRGEEGSVPSPCIKISGLPRFRCLDTPVQRSRCNFSTLTFAILFELRSRDPHMVARLFFSVGVCSLCGEGRKSLKQ